MRRIAAPRWPVVVLALLIDLLLGDPPNALHPVAWMGAAIARCRRQAPRQGKAAPFAYGLLLVTGGCLATMGIVRLLIQLGCRLPVLWSLLLEAALFKMTFSVRGLLRAAEAVYAPLQRGDWAQARRQLGWHLVSRDVSQLTPSQIAAAAIESLAENLSDGVVAPLWYYVLGGLPAAAVYRFLNTADSMLGYRDEAHEWLGKGAARLDDGANLLPARLTAFLLLLGAVLSGQNPANGWRIWRQDAGQTASPNAGHPMSAAAGVLIVELEKVGHYRLGRGQRLPTAADIRRGSRLVRITALLAAALAALALYWQQSIHRN